MELEVSNLIKDNFRFLLDKIDSLELIELIKIDFEHGIKLAIASINMKKDYTIEDIVFPENVQVLSVLRKDGGKYTCLVKAKFYKQFNQLAKKFDLDIIWDVPSFISDEKIMISAIGDNENLKKLLDVMKLVGDIKKTSFKKATFKEQALLTCLTDKQIEVLIAAKKNGYYNYPRKINSKQLSQKVGLSKPTVVQHLRKAEVRLISNILAGY